MWATEPGHPWTESVKGRGTQLFHAGVREYWTPVFSVTPFFLITALVLHGDPWCTHDPVTSERSGLPVLVTWGLNVHREQVQGQGLSSSIALYLLHMNFEKHSKSHSSHHFQTFKDQENGWLNIGESCTVFPQWKNTPNMYDTEDPKPQVLPSLCISSPRDNQLDKKWSNDLVKPQLSDLLR
jgi:hypothetical protein